MKPGINQWSLPLHVHEVDKAVKLSVDAGIRHIELCVEPLDARELNITVSDTELYEVFDGIRQAVNAQDYVLKITDDESKLQSLKEAINAQGAEVISVTTLDLFRYTLTSDNQRIREVAHYIVKRLIDICSQLGGTTVLIEPGVVTSGLSYQQAYGNCRDSLKELSKYAEEKHVVLALENVWGKFLMSPLEFKQLLKEIDSDYVKAYFDVANILEYGFPQDWIRILADDLACIHFKDYKQGCGAGGFCNPFDGNIDWRAVREALRDVRYEGYIVAEAILPGVWEEAFLCELGKKMNYFIEEM